MQVSGVGSMANMAGTQKSATASAGAAGEAAEPTKGPDNDGDSDDMKAQATGKGTKVSTTA